MSCKQLISLLTVCIVVILYCVPISAKPIGVVNTNGVATCGEAKKNFYSTKVRIQQLIEQHNTERDSSLRFVIKEEARFVAVLGNSIKKWIYENCRDA